MAYTITFDESVKGWTSFHSYIPDWMGSLNGFFYTVKDGNLYKHDIESNPVRNNFYGVQYPSVVKVIVNMNPSDVKFFKALNTESNKAFDVVVLSYLRDQIDDTTRSTIDVGEFLEKEGKFYAYVRRNELTGDYTSKSNYGLGRVQSVVGSVITLTTNVPNSLISVGDELYDISNNLIGNITDYDTQAGTVTVDTLPAIAANTFLYGQKSGRIEGSEIRGYNFEVVLTDNTTGRLEFYCLNSEVAKSYPS